MLVLANEGTDVSGRIVLVLKFRIKSGLEQQASEDMAAIVAAVPPDSPITYRFFVDPGHARTVYALETHPDSQSLMDHMTRVGPLLAQSRKSANLISMKVFGNASALLVHALRKLGIEPSPDWTPGAPLPVA